MKTCVGLFGTCGGSKWRDPFINWFEQNKINYFNPQVDDWKPELADIEADHLANDDVILFPVTDETYGIGSLAEVGFSILQAIKMNGDRTIIVFIDQNLQEHLESNAITTKESRRARKLVAAHLKVTKYPNVIVVESLDAMFTETKRLIM